jgi:hypothetical protein
MVRLMMLMVSVPIRCMHRGRSLQPPGHVALQGGWRQYPLALVPDGSPQKPWALPHCSMVGLEESMIEMAEYMVGMAEFMS